MEDLFKPIKTIRKVQTNIDKFETLSLTESTPSSRPATATSKVSILDLNSEASESRSETFSLRPSHASSSASQSSDPRPSNHKRHETEVFVREFYLGKASPASLSDDAREILKSQPEVGDLAAVLQYLQYGIEGKHGFNIRVPDPKASQIINVLVTVTIPDVWQLLRQSKLPTQHARLRANLIASLSSVAGIGAILMQIKRLSATDTSDENPLLVNTISVLSSILAGNKVLAKFLSDATSLPLTDAQRLVFWQEATSLFVGSKILSALSQVFASRPDLKGLTKSEKWLGDGLEYCKWLAKNISAVAVSATIPAVRDNRQMKMLSQVLKRALGLGYRGKPYHTERPLLY
jgi:hypothetical protein